MKLKPGTPLAVSFEFLPGDAVAVGRLALERGTALFEYVPGFAGPELAPSSFFPPPTGELISARAPRDFRGLHGVFAHSLPDAWGLALMRRRAEKLDVQFDSLTALDILAIIGRRGAGALIYEPEIRANDSDDRAIDLDAIAQDATAAADDDEVADIDQLARLGGPSGGARPKLLIGMDASGKIIAGDRDLPPGYEHWIVKFRSKKHDVPEIGAIEAAYADMARAAGLDVSPTRLLRGKSDTYFATQRFDRLSHNGRLHMLSAASLLEIDWDSPGVSYDNLLRLALHVTRDHQAVEMTFRRMIFNVLAHNRDDHANQHAFLMTRNGEWHLAPSFDLTYSFGYNNEHYLDVGGRGGDDIALGDFEKLAKAHDISNGRLATIFGEVSDAVGRFRSFASSYSLGTKSTADIDKELQRGLTRLSKPRA